MSGALGFTYRYAYASGIEAAEGGRPRLSLVTCNPDHARP